MSSYIREATHAGSWYNDDADTLSAQVDAFLSAAAPKLAPKLAAVIVPHAGLRYSGATAAYAYGAIDAAAYDRVYVLGPSHHAALAAPCGVSGARRLATPLGELRVDRHTTRELLSSDTNLFTLLERDVDEAEHSLELQFPFLARVFAARLAEVRFVPLMVGAVDAATHARLAAALAAAFGAPRTLFVISSDFCHWGARFSFQPADCGSWREIEALDRAGMALIEARDAPAFGAYLRRTRNTICGRHPISVLLHLMADVACTCRFVRYAQSSRVAAPDDSSVSYAAALVEFTVSEDMSSD